MNRTWTVALAITFYFASFSAQAFQETETGLVVVGQLEPTEDVDSQDETVRQKLINELHNRIDPDRNSGYSIELLDNDQVKFTFPGATEDVVKAAWKRVTSSGEMSFRIVADENLHPVLFQKARESAEESGPIVETEGEDGETKQIGQWVMLARDHNFDAGEMETQPFKLCPTQSNLFRDEQSGRLVTPDDSIWERASDLERRKALATWCDENDCNELQVLMCLPLKERQDVRGDAFVSARKSFSDGRPRFEFGLNPEGAKRLFSLTSRHRPVGGRYSLLGVVLDGELLSAPRLNEPIRANGVIEGNFTEAEVDQIVQTFSWEKLPIPVAKEMVSIEVMK